MWKIEEVVRAWRLSEWRVVGEDHMETTFDGWERCCRRRAWAHRVHEERIAIDRREVFAEASQSVTPEVK